MITQGTFALLALDDREIEAQIRYALDSGWAISVEHTDDPHPRNTYWELWGMPMFDLTDASVALAAVRACRQAAPDHYVKVSAFDASKGRETIALSFLVQRPAIEPDLRLERSTRPGRALGYALRAVARGPA